ncbi:MAG: chitobiase/beta-hexosaminidase C-terminal domain-containing protein [Romboutsia timonensis]|uniref:chitobiase/beta-hexosaminidase C-terminal domain-containing protein n=1 Tax=Romboutsia timonensis TaxID=1776391 RepID=UPI002A75636A|nr:chitobiase/beta-hexosaminidase C-terminal domain-containing protein [Romboutsia timonensis]MDY2881468.1 chitobiase/beta-hexosaminidase C-terminal domain-containing protein [Romboutsia timonensis]
MKDRKKIGILIIAIVIAISSIFIYKGAIAPKLYDKYLNTGIKYLMDGQYEEAILAFDKAIKIEPKTTEARVYQAKAYVGNEELDKAVNVLEEVQNIDMTNEELLKEILEILNEIDSDIAYEFLDRFIQSIGKDNISQGIKDILDSSNEVPSEPIADPAPGTYVNDISVKLKSDKMKVGHSYYYTLDGSHPNKGSNKYRGQIEISKSTTIKLIGYNKKDESTEVINLEYIIDKNIIEEVKDSIAEGETLIKDTIVGTEIGNISKKDKDKLQLIISETKDLLNKDSLSYEEVSVIKDKIENCIEEFKNNILKPVDKSKLNSAINEAQNLYDDSTEGSNVGQYKAGSRAILLKSINNAKKVNNNKLAKQENIDNELIELRNSINKFKTMKIQDDLEKQILNKYIFEWKKETNANGVIYYDNKRITKFTKNKISEVVLESDVGGDIQILSKSQEGNTIIYKTNSYYGTIKVEVLGNSMIKMNGATYKLLTLQELMSTLHNISSGYVEMLLYCGLGITQNDIDKFYANR